MLLSKILLYVDKTMFTRNDKSKFISLKYRRSSRSQVLYKMTVLKNFAKFTENGVFFQSKVAGSIHVSYPQKLFHRW